MLSDLREIVGPDPPDDTLRRLLAKHNFDVAAAANAFFDGSRGGSEPIDGTPVAPPPSEAGLLQVTVPAGMHGGQELRVETESGAMRVTIPAGLIGGSVFLVRPPVRQQQTPMRQQQIPVARYVGSSQPYPGANIQPTTVVVQQPPPVVVQRPPVYGYGYGYGYGYDPLLAGSMGFLGGMLVADALFW